jgi:hypothetical protein
MNGHRLLSPEMESAAAQCGFDCPRGPIGSVIGYFMAWTHGWRNPWVLGLLNVKPEDHVLGIGFGPGTEITWVARRATRGFVAGVDTSEIMVPLIEQSRMVVDELIDVAGRATIEAVLQLSAEQVAGPRSPGQRRTGLLWHGRQAGQVCVQERKLGVTKPRLREKGGGEVAISGQGV